MEKFISFEHTFSKQEIEKILANHIHQKLMKEDLDYKGALLVSHQDFTYSFKDDSPSIFMITMIKSDLQDPKKKRK